MFHYHEYIHPPYSEDNYLPNNSTFPNVQWGFHSGDKTFTHICSWRNIRHQRKANIGQQNLKSIAQSSLALRNLRVASVIIGYWGNIMQCSLNERAYLQARRGFLIGLVLAHSAPFHLWRDLLLLQSSNSLPHNLLLNTQTHFLTLPYILPSNPFITGPKWTFDHLSLFIVYYWLFSWMGSRTTKYFSLLSKSDWASQAPPIQSLDLTYTLIKVLITFTLQKEISPALIIEKFFTFYNKK